MLLTNNTTKCFVFDRDLVLQPSGTLTIDDARYASDARVRYNVNRQVGIGNPDITASSTPVGYPDTTTDPVAETTPRLKPMFQVK